LILEGYHNNAPFGEIFEALKEMGGSAFDFLLYLQDHEELHKPRIREIFEKFVKGGTSNLYDSHEIAESVALSDEFFDQFVSGDLGFNEIIECRADLYFEMEDTLSILLDALKEYLDSNGLLNVRVKDYFEQLGEFVLNKNRNIRDTDTIYERFYNYDFESISKLGFKVDPRSVKRFKVPLKFRFYHDKKQKKQIRQAQDQYENHPGGISRMLYVQNLKQMYRKFENVSTAIAG